jgi:outer membrane protein assembly complex protein YaeT
MPAEKKWRLPRVFWIPAAVLALVVTVGTWLLHTRPVRDYALKRVRVYLKSQSNFDFEARSLDYNLLSGRIWLEGVRLTALANPGNAPFLEAAIVRADLGLFDLFGGRIHVEEAVIEGLSLQALFDEQGGSNLPLGGASETASGAPSAPPSFLIESLEVRDGAFSCADRRQNIEVGLPRWTAGITGNSLTLHHELQFQTIAPGTAFFEGRSVPIEALTVTAALNPDQLQIQNFEAQTEALQLAASGTVEEFANPSLQLKAQATTDIAQAAQFLGVQQDIAGSVEAGFTVEGRTEDLTVDGTVRAADARFGEFRQISLDAAGSWNSARQNLRLDRATVRSPAGQIDLQGDVATAEGGGTSRVQAGFDGLNLETLTGQLDTPLRVASSASGTAAAEWPGIEWSQATGTAQLQLNPLRDAVSENVLPIAGSLALNGQSDRLQVTAHSLRLLDSRVEADITLTDRQHLEGQLNGDAADLKAFLAAAGTFLGQPEDSPLRAADVAGSMTFSATLAGTLDQPSASATVEGRELAMGELTGGQATIEAAYAPRRLDIQQATLLWKQQTISAQGSIGFEGDSPTLDLTARLDQVSLQSILAAAGQQAPVSGTLNLNAVVQGTTAAPRAEADLTLTDLVAYQEPWGNLTAHLRSQGPKVALTNLDLQETGTAGEAGSLRASGSYALDTAEYDVKVQGEQLEMTNLTLPDGAIVRGRLNANLQGTGTIEQPDLAGDLAVGQLQLNERALGDLSSSFSLRNGAARINAALPLFNLAAEGEVGAAAPYPAQLKLIASQTDLSKLEFQLDGEPLNGAVSGTVDASGEIENWRQGSLTARITEFETGFAKRALRNEGDLVVRYENEVLSVDRSTLHVDDSRITADGSLPLDPAAPPGKLALDTDLNLNTLASLIPSEEPLAAQGRLSLHASLEGTLSNLTPQFEATVSQAAFFTPAIIAPLMGLEAAVRLRDGALHLDGLKAEWAGAGISASGQLPLSFLSTSELPFNLPASQEPARFQFDLSGLVINSFSDLPREMDGTISIHAEAEAPRLELEAVRGEVRLDQFQLRYKSFDLTQQRPATIAIENGRGRVDHFLLTGPDTEISAKGEMELAGARAIDLQLNMKTDAGILALPAENVSAAGAAELQLAVRGTADAPELDGGLQLRGGQLAIPSPQLQATGLNAAVRFKPGAITVETLSGNLNGGTLQGSGTIEYAGSEIRNVNLDLAADNVFVDFPEGLRTLSKSKIELRSAEDSIVVGGQVLIEEGAYSRPIELNRFLFDYVRSRSVPAFETDPDPLLSRLRYNVDLSTVEPLVIDNNLAEMAAELELRLVGTYYRPSITGQVNLQEGGSLYIGENRYYIDRGTIDFLSEARIEPVLDIVARTQARRKYDIELRIAGGGAEDISTSLTSSSHPDLAEPDLISLLLTGRTQEELRGEEVNAAAEQSLSYLTGAVGSRLSRGAQQSLGLSEVRIEPNLIAAESDPGARLTLGQNLTDQLSLVYSTNLADSSDQIWIAQYDITRRFTTQATMQEDSTYRFDLSHDLRFGGAPDTGRLPTDARFKKPIGEVRFEGAAALDQKQLADKLQVKPGKPYDFFTVRRGVERLDDFFAKQGYLQAKIDADRETKDDRVDLAVQIEQGPLVEFIFEGWSASDEVKDRVRTLWREGVFDAQRVNDSIRAIREALVEDGYLQSEVGHIISTPSEDRKRVVFEISLGTRFRDVELEFAGASAFSNSELKQQLQKAKLTTAVHTTPGQVTDFLGQFYRSQGYLNAKIDRPSYQLDAARATGRVVIPVEEGPRFQIAGFEFDGNAALSAEELRKALLTPEDGIYRPEFLQDALVRLEERYWREGYNDVAISFSPRKDDAAGVVTVATKITENKKGIVQSVEVEGTHETSENLVRGQLGLEPGDTLNFEQVTKARRNLYRMGAYSLVDVRSEVLDPQLEPGLHVEPGQQPVRMKVKVREVKPYQVRYGAFYDTERGPGFIADFTNRNTLGSARVVGLRTRYDADVHEARLYFSQPLLRRLPLQNTATAFARREFEADFITDRIGISLVQETRWREKWVLNYGYRFEKTHTFLAEQDPLFPFDVTLHVAPLSTTLSRETRDEILDATRGSFFSTAFEYAPAALGSDLRFVRYFGQFFKYIPLGEPKPIPFQGSVRKPRLVYAGGVRVGLARGLGGQELIPSERFFAGGGTTMRGFARDSLGPRNVLDEPAGGDAVFVVNNEIRFPLISIFDGVGFLDLGNVYDRVSDFDPFSIRKSAGFGLRLRTPYFLLRADYGFKLDRREGESAGAFFFSIGQAF